MGKIVFTLAFVAGLTIIMASDDVWRHTIRKDARSEPWSQVQKCGRTVRIGMRRSRLALRGGSWNPVKWFEDAVENTMKEEVKDLIHSNEDKIDEGL